MGQFTSATPLSTVPDHATVRPCFQATACPHVIVAADLADAELAMRVHAGEVHGTATHLIGAAR